MCLQQPGTFYMRLRVALPRGAAACRALLLSLPATICMRFCSLPEHCRTLPCQHFIPCPTALSRHLLSAPQLGCSPTHAAACCGERSTSHAGRAVCSSTSPEQQHLCILPTASYLASIMACLFAGSLLQGNPRPPDQDPVSLALQAQGTVAAAAATWGVTLLQAGFVSTLQQACLAQASVLPRPPFQVVVVPPAHSSAVTGRPSGCTHVRLCPRSCWWQWCRLHMAAPGQVQTLCWPAHWWRLPDCAGTTAVPVAPDSSGAACVQPQPLQSSSVRWWLLFCVMSSTHRLLPSTVLIEPMRCRTRSPALTRPTACLSGKQAPHLRACPQPQTPSQSTAAPTCA